MLSITGYISLALFIFSAVLAVKSLIEEGKSK